jgi:hypothetical protein
MLTIAVLLLFLAAVIGLTAATHRRSNGFNGCCAPTDPVHDSRMRDLAAKPNDSGDESRTWPQAR